MVEPIVFKVDKKALIRVRFGAFVLIGAGFLLLLPISKYFLNYGTQASFETHAWFFGRTAFVYFVLLSLIVTQWLRVPVNAADGRFVISQDGVLWRIGDDERRIAWSDIQIITPLTYEGGRYPAAIWLGNDDDAQLSRARTENIRRVVYQDPVRVLDFPNGLAVPMALFGSKQVYDILRTIRDRTTP